MTTARAAVAMALGALGLSGASAWAHAPVAPDHALPAPSARAPEQLGPQTARAITRLAVIDLRLRQSPRAADAFICEHLLSLALESEPGNAEIVRVASWISDLSEDDSLTASYLRRLVEMDPADTFSQYRLISNLLRSIQDSDARLARYNAFLGEQGKSLAPAIRSRLASEAAQLLLERGDEEGAVAKLKLAASLDSTNKDAAIASYRYFRSKITDPAGRAELLVNLLMADPVSFDTHDELAHVLASGGAFDAAKRFQTTANSIQSRAGNQQDMTGVIEALCVDWAVEGPGSAVSELNKTLAIRRRDQERMLKAMEEQLIPTQDVPKVDEIRLDPPLDKLRIFAALAAGDRATAESAAADFKASYDKPIEYLEHPPEQLAVDIADPAGEARALRLERASLLLWADVQTEFALGEVDSIAGTGEQNQQEPAMLEARAWSLVRRGDGAGAVGLFSPLKDKRPLSRVGLALALEQAGRKDEARNECVSIMREMPMTTESVWAWERGKALTGSNEVDAPLVRRLRDIGSGIPTWVDDATRDPGRLMTLTVDLIETSLDACEPARLHVRLSNVSPLVLGVGPGRTIDSNLLLSPVLQVGLDTMRQGIAPELIDAERRIRLAPRETLEFDCWPDPGLSGWLAESLATDAVRARWNVIQGYMQGPDGQVVPGAMCLRAGTKPLVRPAMAETSLPVPELAAKIGAASEADLYRLAVAVRALLLSLVEDPSNPAAGAKPRPRLSESDAATLARAFAEKYVTCGVTARRMLASTLPHAHQTPAIRPVDDAILADEDPGVTAISLVSRTSSINDPVLARGAASSDERLRSLADRIKSRIEAGGRLYATLGPGLAGLVGRAPETGAEQPSVDSSGVDRPNSPPSAANGPAEQPR